MFIWWLWKRNKLKKAFKIFSHGNAFNWIPVVWYHVTNVARLHSKIHMYNQLIVLYKFHSFQVSYEYMWYKINVQYNSTQRIEYAYIYQRNWDLHVFAALNAFHSFYYLFGVAFAMIEYTRKIIALLVRDIEFQNIVD